MVLLIYELLFISLKKCENEKEPSFLHFFSAINFSSNSHSCKSSCQDETYCSLSSLRWQFWHPTATVRCTWCMRGWQQWGVHGVCVGDDAFVKLKTVWSASVTNHILRLIHQIHMYHLYLVENTCISLTNRLTGIIDAHSKCQILQYKVLEQLLTANWYRDPQGSISAKIYLKSGNRLKFSNHYSIHYIFHA